MTARDYVSGAMENTTATLHQESAQQDARELVDGNNWESTIAHELFHQWFGDYVTAESWSNLTVNESFANYSQLLWWEHKLGKDEALFEHYNEMQGYLFSGSQNKDLVRFNYNDKEDMFDAVSYNKGGRILHMLRNYIGDDAFFTALNKYLSANKFGNGSAHKLRMAFEEVTGKDLNWYFNQWYFGSGHPKLEISYDYNNATRTASVIVAQTQKGDKVFKLPINIDVWNGDAKTRHMVWAENKVDTFNFTVTAKPDNINVDADKILLAEKKDTKTLEAYAHQYFHAGNFLDRREAVAFMYDIDNAKSELGRKVLLAALSDTSFRIRSFAINAFTRLASDAVVINKAVEITKKDPSRLARAAAIDYLGMQRSELLADLFTNACYDSSYTVSGAALRALTDIDSAAGKKMTILLNKQPSKGRLNATLIENSIRFGDASSYDFIMSSFNKMGLTMEKIQMTNQIAFFLGKTNDVVKIKEGVTAIVDFRESIPEAYKPQISPMINKGLTGLVTSLEKAGNKEAANFVSTKLPAPKN
jgi:aminopeptidase N